MSDETEDNNTKTKSAFSNLRASGKSWFNKAKIVGNAAISKSKASLKLATDEFRNHVTEVYTHGEQAQTGMKHTADKVKANPNVQKVQKVGQSVGQKSKVIAKKTSSVAMKATSTLKELVESGFHATMDCDDQAGFPLVYHYSNQFAKLHHHSAETQNQAKYASDIIHTRLAQTKLGKQKLTSLQAELSALPNSMSTLTTTVETIHALRKSLHGVEDQLLKLEKTSEDLAFFKATASQRHVILEYKLATESSVNQHKKKAEMEYRKARREASRSASKLIKERQAVLGEMFQAQMALFKEQGRQDVLVGSKVSPISLSRQESIVDPEDNEHMAAFLASTQSSRRPSSDDTLAATTEQPAPPIPKPRPTPPKAVATEQYEQLADDDDDDDDDDDGDDGDNKPAVLTTNEEPEIEEPEEDTTDVKSTTPEKKKKKKNKKNKNKD